MESEKKKKYLINTKDRLTVARCEEWEKWVKVGKRYKLPVIKQVSSGDVKFKNLKNKKKNPNPLLRQPKKALKGKRETNYCPKKAD